MRLMTEYDFVVVQITKIKAHILRFFHLNECENKCIDFVICTSTKSYKALTSYAVKETIMEYIYFEIRLNYQKILLLSEIQFRMITRTKMDHAITLY